jgi:hypothetical protein
VHKTLLKSYDILLEFNLKVDGNEKYDGLRF